jgi:hypothetical protein
MAGGDEIAAAKRSPFSPLSAGDVLPVTGAA